MEEKRFKKDSSYATCKNLRLLEKILVLPPGGWISGIILAIKILNAK
jgi:hypothetical protein